MKINCIWLTYQSCLNEIIECHGDNDYKIPHMGKEKLEREGRLPHVLEVTNHTYGIVDMMGIAPCEIADLDEREALALLNQLDTQDTAEEY